HFTLHSVPHGTVPFDRLSRGGEGGASRLTARDTAKRPIPGALAAGCTTLEGTNSVGCRGGWVRACDGLSGRRRHDPPLPRPPHRTASGTGVAACVVAAGAPGRNSGWPNCSRPNDPITAWPPSDVIQATNARTAGASRPRTRMAP